MKYHIHILKKSCHAAALLLTAVMLVLPQGLYAQTDSVKVDEFYYFLNQDDTTAQLIAEESGFDITGALEIPSTVTYGGLNYKVTSVGDDAFAFCTNLTSITIPSTVLTICESAFQGCSSVIKVTFTLNNLKRIEDAAFEGCSALTSITIPTSVEYIGDWAFHGCTSLKLAIVPENVTYLGKNAFMRCTGIVTASIKAKLSYIPDGIFDHCTALQKFTIPAESYAGVKTAGIASFYDCPKLESFTFNDSITRIEPCCFMGCKSISSFTLPESVNFIGHHAFDACTNMTSINIPDIVDTIGSAAFKDDSKLTSISMSDSVKYLGEEAFAYCSSLTSARLSNNISEIGFKAFAYCTNLENINIPPNITSIGDSAFINDAKIDTVNVPRGVTYLGNYAFANCGTIDYVYIPRTVTDFGDYIFKEDSIKTFYIEIVDAPAVSYDFFDYCDTLYVPKHSIVHYFNKSYAWYKAKHKKVFDADIVGITSPGIESDDDSPYFTIDGLIDPDPQRGKIYIHNGKKIIKW